MARFRHLHAANNSEARSWDWKHRPNTEPEWRDAGYTPAWDAYVPHGDSDVWYQVRQLSHELDPHDVNFAVHSIGERIPDPRGGGVETRKRHPNVPSDGGGYPLPLGHARTLEEAQDIAGKFHADNYKTFADHANEGGYDLNRIMREHGGPGQPGHSGLDDDFGDIFGTGDR